MIPITQTIFNPDFTKGETGDCMAASIASVLELPLSSVPNFVAIGRTQHPDQPNPLTDSQSDWWYYLRDWLAPRGFMFFEFPADAHPAILSALGYHLIAGDSPRGDWKHVVVGYRGNVVHDPHPDRTGLRKIDFYGVFVALNPEVTG